MKVDFYAGLASFRQITRYYNRVCLPGIFNSSYAKGDLPFEGSNIEYMVDSGAFQDVNKDKRLEFEDAFDRQMSIIEYAKIPPKYIVSYDFLVDEKYIGNGVKVKGRVDYQTAEYYVEETIKAAKYYDTQRNGVDIILSVQGVNPEQYYRCANEVLNYSSKEDVFGLGGFCILGLQPTLIPSALLTFQSVIPLVKQAGLSKIHIFGVTSLDILYILGQMCQNYELRLSTDSTAFSRAARFGDWVNVSTGRRKYIGKKITNSWELATLNVLNYAWILEDIENRYIYKGKPGWLQAIDFEYNPSINLGLF